MQICVKRAKENYHGYRLINAKDYNYCHIINYFTWQYRALYGVKVAYTLNGNTFI